MAPSFEWDNHKNSQNISKHGVSFTEAQQAFYDPLRVIARDTRHSTRSEKRFFCFGRLDEHVVTVRFTVRKGIVRIFGAGHWREGRRRYEEANGLPQGTGKTGSGDS